jgi:hypothetical protein
METAKMKECIKSIKSSVHSNVDGILPAMAKKLFTIKLNKPLRIRSGKGKGKKGINAVMTPRSLNLQDTNVVPDQ